MLHAGGSPNNEVQTWYTVSIILGAAAAAVSLYLKYVYLPLFAFLHIIT
jgi:hypothetical protein